MKLSNDFEVKVLTLNLLFKDVYINIRWSVWESMFCLNCRSHRNDQFLHGSSDVEK